MATMYGSIIWLLPTPPRRQRGRVLRGRGGTGRAGWPGTRGAAPRPAWSCAPSARGAEPA